MFKRLLRYKEIKEWYGRHERFLIPATLVLGVIADFLTFININITTSFILLGVYFFIAGAAIIFLNAYDAGMVSTQKNFYRYLRLAAPLALQFTFGALLSGSFIFYIFSGTLFVSWPFVAVIVILMISNEIFRHYYLRPEVQIGVYYFIFFTLSSIILPFVLYSISFLIFILSGLLSLLLIFIYTAIFGQVVPEVRRRYGRFAVVITIIFALMNGLYFLNVLPPIPLALRDAALAHDIKRAGNNYTMLLEEEPLRNRIFPGSVFHKTQFGAVYVYTAIFAPKGLETKIVHRWQYYDEAQKQWVTRDKLSFDINGGAKTGYRGYSFKSQVDAGRWRVNVETERGQSLGRINFRVLDVAVESKLKVLIK